MEIGSLLILIALFFLVILFIAYPLIIKGMPDLTENEKSILLLESQRKVILRSISELDFEREIEKISSEVHAAQRGKLFSDAAMIYQKMDEILDKELVINKKGSLEKSILKKRNEMAHNIFCNNCENPLISGDKFCSNCGESIS